MNLGLLRSTGTITQQTWLTLFTNISNQAYLWLLSSHRRVNRRHRWEPSSLYHRLPSSDRLRTGQRFGEDLHPANCFPSRSRRSCFNVLTDSHQPPRIISSRWQTPQCRLCICRSQPAYRVFNWPVSWWIFCRLRWMEIWLVHECYCVLHCLLGCHLRDPAGHGSLCHSCLFEAQACSRYRLGWCDSRKRMLWHAIICSRVSTPSARYNVL